MVEAIEKASEHILRQTLVIKDLTARMSSLEDIVSELDNGIEDYR
jgi:hypothetical protein